MAANSSRIQQWYLVSTCSDGVIDDAAQLELCSTNGSEWYIGGAEEFNDL